jgi:hypothetical protein
MLTERDRHKSTAGETTADAHRAFAAMTPAELEMGTAAEQRCRSVVIAVIEKFAGPFVNGEDGIRALVEARWYRVPGPNQRVARLIANLYERSKCVCEDGWNTLANHIQAFGRDAEECIERMDGPGLDRAISALVAGANAATCIAPPQTPLMPGPESFAHYAWSAQEMDGLQAILLTPMCGVARGDAVEKLDEIGVTLKSGKRLSRGEIIAANRPAWMGPMVRPATEPMRRQS